MKTPIKGNAEDYKSKTESPMRNPWLNKDCVEEDASGEAKEKPIFSKIMAVLHQIVTRIIDLNNRSRGALFIVTGILVIFFFMAFSTSYHSSQGFFDNVRHMSFNRILVKRYAYTDYWRPGVPSSLAALKPEQWSYSVGRGMTWDRSYYPTDVIRRYKDASFYLISIPASYGVLFGLVLVGVGVVTSVTSKHNKNN